MKHSNIFRGIAALTLAVALAWNADAANQASGTIFTLPVNDATLTRSGDIMNVDMHLDLAAMQLKGDKAIIITPYIVNGNDSLPLQSIGLYSRNRWYQYDRNNNFPGAPDTKQMRFSDRPAYFDVQDQVAFQNWMNGSHIAVKGEVYGCCNTLVEQQVLDLDARYKEYQPTFIYQTVTDMVNLDDVAKNRELSGRAYVDFPVNQIVIYPNYHNNEVELGKIIATIDSVKNDPDVTVKSIFIKGTASPEGPYQNNVRLAKGRTEALKEYVRNLYHFPEGFIQTDYEPVDWEGLRDYLLGNGRMLEHSAQILEIVNSDLEPYARNQKIKTTYPQQYKYLLDNVYPLLRHSDYRIEYTIRKFTTAEEIAALLHTNPGKLTLNEMLFLAQTYETGSDEFNDVMEMAVRMFPDDPVANLNVGTSALQRGDLVSAAKYLPRAGTTPEAVYARANLAFLQGDMATARKLFEEAAQYLPTAAATLTDFNDAGY